MYDFAKTFTLHFTFYNTVTVYSHNTPIKRIITNKIKQNSLFLCCQTFWSKEPPWNRRKIYINNINNSIINNLFQLCSSFHSFHSISYELENNCLLFWRKKKWVYLLLLWPSIFMMMNHKIVLILGRKEEIYA
jgi:hypothetical protein